MGDLVAMSRSKPLPIREELASGHSAEILFFTGVRYYRFDEREISPVIAAPARKRRPTAKQRAAEALLATRRQEAIA